jgi:ketosteroid isomerase-like protein
VAFPSASAAETAFYEAFANGDHAALMRVWARGGNVVCVHPMGPRLSGIDAVSASWRQILTGEPGREFETRLKTSWGDANLAVHVVDEIISIPARNTRFSPVLATNVYRRLDGHWYMTMHHASIDASRHLGESRNETSQTRH